GRAPEDAPAAAVVGAGGDASIPELDHEAAGPRLVHERNARACVDARDVPVQVPHAGDVTAGGGGEDGRDQGDERAHERRLENAGRGSVSRYGARGSRSSRRSQTRRAFPTSCRGSAPGARTWTSVRTRSRSSSRRESSPSTSA